MIRIMAVQFVKEDFGIAWLLRDSIQYQLDNKILYDVPTTFELPEIQLQLAYIDNIFVHVYISIFLSPLY